MLLSSLSAYGADNATITGDKVNVRYQPAVWEKSWGTLDRGTRVEAAYVSDFTDTIDGYTAPWYYIVCTGCAKRLLNIDNSGYVFGRYVAIEPGAAVPLLRDRSWYEDPIERFIKRGLNVCGINEAAIIKTLGRPVSTTDYKTEDDNADGGYVFRRRLTYRSIVIEMRKKTEYWPEEISKLTMTTDAYAVNGLKVGSTPEDVERVLGAPAEKTDRSLMYHDAGYFGSHTAVFTIRDGVVTERSSMPHTAIDGQLRGAGKPSESI